MPQPRLCGLKKGSRKAPESERTEKLASWKSKPMEPPRMHHTLANGLSSPHRLDGMESLEWFRQSV